MKGGGHMKAAMSFLMIALVLVTFIGVAVAKDMSGEVIAVDAIKGTLTLKSGTVDVGFDCETGSLVKDVKVGDHVTVEYKEVGGKKKATKVTQKKKKAAGGY
jgi:opacity protein-like surface antigen